MLEILIILGIDFGLKLWRGLNEACEISFELILNFLETHQDVIFACNIAITPIFVYPLEWSFYLPDQLEDQLIIKLIDPSLYRLLLDNSQMIFGLLSLQLLRLNILRLDFPKLTVHFLKELNKIDNNIVRLDVADVDFTGIVDIVEILG